MGYYSPVVLFNFLIILFLLFKSFHVLDDVIINWKQNVILDINNNDFYLSDYKEPEEGNMLKINRMKINNRDSGMMDSFEMTLSHIYDFIGHHL